jgi:hypothetical protein
VLSSQKSSVLRQRGWWRALAPLLSMSHMSVSATWRNLRALPCPRVILPCGVRGQECRVRTSLKATMCASRMLAPRPHSTLLWGGSPSVYVLATCDDMTVTIDALAGGCAWVCHVVARLTGGLFFVPKTAKTLIFFFSARERVELARAFGFELLARLLTASFPPTTVATAQECSRSNTRGGIMTSRRQPPGC